MVTDEYLRMYFERPELAPVAEIMPRASSPFTNAC